MLGQVNLIEPCCVERTLPALLPKGGGATQFVTMGDVTVTKIYQAVAYLSGSERVVIACQQVTAELLKPVATWVRRGWTQQVVIVTTDATAAREAARKTWGDKADRLVTIAEDERTARQPMLMLYGKQGVVTLIGPLLTRTDAGVTLYSISYHREKTALEKAIDSRVKRFVVATVPDASPSGDNDNQNEKANDNEHPEEMEGAQTAAQGVAGTGAATEERGNGGTADDGGTAGVEREA